MENHPIASPQKINYLSLVGSVFTVVGIFHIPFIIIPLYGSIFWLITLLLGIISMNQIDKNREAYSFNLLPLFVVTISILALFIGIPLELTIGRIFF